MKTFRTIFVSILAATLLCLAVSAAAGELDRGSEGVKKAVRVDKMPTMQFLSGRLKLDVFGHWKLGEYMISVRPDAVLTMDGDDGGTAELKDGFTAILMGCGSGENFVVYGGTIQSPEYANARSMGGENVVWSDVDSSVGIGEGPE